MRRLFSLITIVLLAVIAGSQGVAHAQTQTQMQQHSIIIDEQSFAPVQTDVMSGVAIDKIQPDNSRRPCARIKMHINRMTRKEIDGIVVQPIGGSVVVMKQIVAAEGNGLIVELTAKQPTRFYLHHDKYGDSNEVSLNLEGDKEYRLSAQLNIAYPIFIKSNVAEAEVYIDNEYKGHTNDRYTLIVKDIQPGRHTLKIKYGTEVKEQDIEVTSNNLDFDIGLSTKASLPQIIEFSVKPANATVYINDTPYSAQRDGVVTIALNKGSYNYRVSADMYHDERGSLTVTDSTVSKSITLKPAHGWVEIESNAVLNGAKIYIDDSYIGKAPLKSNKLASGEHRIEVIQEMYLPYEGTILIKDNETLLFNPSLNANFAIVTLNVDNEAKIYVNNEYKGFSTWTGNLAAGQYTFEARKDNHYPTTITQNISVNPAKQTYTLNTPRPIVGELNITSTPPNAEVYIDGKLIGTTQLKHNVIIGNHEIVVKATGYRSNKQNVTIAEGETINVTFTLEEGSDIPNNVIEYVSNSQIQISSARSAYLFGAGIKSHTWNSKTGKGKIVFESDVTTIGKEAFNNCDNLTSITIPDSVTTIGEYAFYSCSSLTSVTIPDSVTTIGKYAFLGCKSLTSITIPDSVTTIGKGAFEFCDSLTSVTIPDSVTTIGEDAFFCCSSLTSVTIPDSVTTIGRSAFWGCNSLTSVTIPDSVTTIGSFTFRDCSSLTSVYCKAATPPSLGNNVFKKNAFSRKIYVPMQSVEQYKRAKGWKRINGYNF